MRAGLVNFVKSVNAAGKLIDGIGTQSHLGVSSLSPVIKARFLTFNV